MPELIPDGPDIPARLLNALDSGRVVFFCGAGVSQTPGSNLPSFKKLVCDVYKENHIFPDNLESEALDLAETDPGRQRPALDKVLGLLEREERLGAVTLRKTVIGLLSVPASKQALKVHGALIDLSKTEQGVRLITTNFDNRFVEAGLDKELVDAAPKLPIPKPHTWASLVHLHGRIGQNKDGLDLVLTAADFGRAYLVERWAARFITELFREFTVVFIGYSLGDPVMSYMIDALAADRAMGARFAKAYAFTHFDSTANDKSSTQAGWRAKNVEPILYDNCGKHHLLADTLVEWASLRKDPLNARPQIAIKGISTIPIGSDDPLVQRVVWALKDPDSAKALAYSPPIDNEDEFAKLEQWLDIFTEMGLMHCPANNTGQKVSGQNAGMVSLVDNGLLSQIHDNLDGIRRHLSIWLANHLHVPQLLAWVLRNGGYLHPYLRQEIQHRLANQRQKIPARLCLLWTVLLNNRPAVLLDYLWTYHQYLEAESDSERQQIENKVMESITPRIIVRSGPPSTLELRRYFEEKPPAIEPIESCGHLRLVICDDDTWGQLREILQDSGFLSRHAVNLTGYLEQACLLSRDDDETRFDPGYLGSMEVHGQIRDDESWTHLIDLARDSYFALANKNRTQAHKLLLRWVDSTQSIFRKLALHVLTENPKSDIKLARKLLLEGRKPGLWDPEVWWEVLRFFSSAGKRIPGSLRTEIVRAIHSGPISGKRKPSPESDKATLRIKEALLSNLSASGVHLDKKSMSIVKNAKPGVSLGDLGHDEHDEGGWISDEELAPQYLVTGTVAEVVEAIENGKISLDGLRGLAIRKPKKVTLALLRLARQETWQASYWQAFLWYLTGLRDKESRPVYLYYHVARVLSDAPDWLFNKTGSAIAGFVALLAEECDKGREEEFRVIWMKAWKNMGEGEITTPNIGGPLTEALNHPAGKLAEAALARLSKYELRAGEEIPEVLRIQFDAIGNDPTGRLGRVMLAARVHYLFAIDPEWTTVHLISHLSLDRSEEAAALWSAYGWSSRIGPNLLRAFKVSFLEILQNEHLVVQKFGNLIGLFIAVCLETPDELTEEEIRSVIDTFSEKSLMTLLGIMKKRLVGKTAERKVIWQERLFPWLREYWPRIAARNTQKTSVAILDLLAESGDAFPGAVEWSLGYLRPLNRGGLYAFCKNSLPEKYPEEMLQVLEKVVDESVIQIHEKALLFEILDKMVEAHPNMSEDIRFRNLYQISKR